MPTPPANSEPRRTFITRLVSVGRSTAAAVRLGGATALLLAGVGLSGCASARAEVNPAGPPLMMPAPPPRVLLPPEEEPIAVATAAPDPVALVPRVTPTPLPPKRQPAVRSDPEPRVETPAVSSGAPVLNPAEPPRELRTVPSPAVPAAEQANVERFLKRAETDRKNVDPAKLSNEGRGNYEESKRLSEQAIEKLKERNLPHALALAEKAATLAASLR